MPFKSNLVKASLIRPAFGSTLAELVYAWVILLICTLVDYQVRLGHHLDHRL